MKSQTSLEKFYNTKGYYRWQESNFSHDRVKKMTAKIIESIASSKKKLKILDIGSGTGDLIERIRKEFPQHSYWGCDISEQVVSDNAKNKKKIQWTVQEFNNKTSYKDNFFDLIIAGEILEHFYDTDNFMQEAYRITKKGGTMVLTTPNLASWLDRTFLLFGLQPHATEVSNVSRKFGREAHYKAMRISQDVEPAGHLRCFTWGALQSFVTHYKFNVKEHIGCYSHNMFINRFVDKFMPTFSQNQIIVAKK